MTDEELTICRRDVERFSLVARRAADAIGDWIAIRHGRPSATLPTDVLEEIRDELDAALDARGR